MKQIYSKKGKEDCSHNWCKREKIPDMLRIDFCTVCGKERITHERVKDSEAEIAQYVRDKKIEFGEVD